MSMHIPWGFVKHTIQRDAPKLTNFHRIVGLTRGGVILASLIQRFHPTADLALHDPACVLFVGDDNVLVVDDIWDSGKTILQVRDNAFVREGNLLFYTLTTKQQKTISQHSYGVWLDTPKWIHFPWEIEEVNNDR